MRPRPTRRRRMTAATDVLAAAGEASPPQRAKRDARIRGAVFAAFGILALYFASRSCRRRPRSRSGSSSRAATRSRSRRPSAILWILAGVASARRRRSCSSIAGPAFPWRRGSSCSSAPWVVAVLAGAPERQAREHHQRVRGQPRVRRPDLAGRVRRHPVRAERHAQHRPRGQVPHRRLRRVGRREHRRHAHRATPSSAILIGVAAAMLAGGAGRPPAGLARHPAQGGPDHRRHRDQHRRPRDHELPLPARPRPEHLSSTRRPTIEPWRIPILADIPVLGPDLLLRDAVRVRHATSWSSPDLPAVPHPLGPAAPGLRREALGGRHGRHRRHRDPLSLDDPGRR